MDATEKIFLDPRSDDAAVLRAVSRITSGHSSATLWTQVANDPKYRPFHRAVAVYELFKRHVAKPMALKQLARLLDGAPWLLEAAIEKIEVMGGEIPVHIPDHGAGFVVRLPMDSAMTYPAVGMYLALDSTIDADRLRDALMSRITEPPIGQIRIVDFSLFPASLVTPNSP
jgi:hypothetical protein